jgi:hypothetical protein
VLVPIYSIYITTTLQFSCWVKPWAGSQNEGLGQDNNRIWALIFVMFPHHQALPIKNHKAKLRGGTFLYLQLKIGILVEDSSYPLKVLLFLHLSLKTIHFSKMDIQSCKVPSK